jgi:hypothetical protein
VLRVTSLAIAISAVGAGSAPCAIGSAVSALAMGLVILGQVVRLREQGKTAKSDSSGGATLPTRMPRGGGCDEDRASVGPPRTLGRARGSRVTLQKVALPNSHRLASSGSVK